MSEIKWGPTGEMVYKRTYSRTNPDGSKETWPETVERVVDGNLALVDARYRIKNEREDLIRMMTDFQLLPAGRHLWASGVKGAQHLMNCWVSGWEGDIWDHFYFTFMRLMEGGGVGANYSNRFLEDFPLIQHFLNVEIVCDPEHADYEAMQKAGVISTRYSPDWDGAFIIEDSREGWGAALVELIQSHYREDTQNIFRVFDVSRVRPAGARLKTFGGTASGPLPLAKMLIDVSKILSHASGGILTGLEAMEIDHAIAQCVVAGGVRRSARMAMMHWADPEIEEFISIKANSGSHWTTNISVEVDSEFWERLNKPLTPGYADRVGVSDDDRTVQADMVLRSISEGMLHNGEPGFWDSSLSNNGEPNRVDCTNPCLTGDTVIATLDGPRTFADLAEAGKDVEVYSWHPESKTPVVRWMRRPHKTRENTEILKVTFDSGLVVRCTPDHSFYTFRGNKVRAKDLMGLRSKSIRAFSASADGSGHERIHGWDSQRNAANHQYTHRMIWENANGPIPEGMVIAHLDHDAGNNTLENLEVMTPYDHASYDWELRHRAGFGAKGVPNHKVVSVEPGGFADVYNGMVEDSHTYIVLDPEPVAGHMSGIVSANCGEIALQASEPCNLGHVNLAGFIDSTGTIDYSGMYRAHRLMTRFLIRATFSEVSDPKSAEVLARNRRIGVGHLGVASFLAMAGVKYSEAEEFDEDTAVDFPYLLGNLKEAVEGTAARFAHTLRIPVPVKTTTVAPTGSVAKLPGVSEGIHPIFARYFIRRVRLSNVDPDQVKMMDAFKEDGYHVEDSVTEENTAVVSIATKDTLVQSVADIYGDELADHIVQGADDLTLSDMLRFQAMYQKHYANNAVSYTANLTSADYTADQVANILKSFGGQLKGATVFPDKSFVQAPYERLTKEEYDSAFAKAVSDGIDEECANGSCPIR